jgi:glycosyltransferase involved in cell wall biosynthesis
VTPIRVLELRSVRGTGGGPEKTILGGAARSDPRRFAVTVCYIRDRRDNVFAMDRIAADLGVDYVEIVERHSFDRGIWKALRALVRDRQIDIVHAHEYKTDLLAWLLARADRIVPLSTVHGWSGATVRELLCYYPADRQILRSFPRVVAVSGAIRERLLRAGLAADRVVTVLNGIDAGVFRREAERVPAARRALNLPAGASIIGAVGRLEREKRYDVLIDAVAAVRQSGRDVRLVFAGTGSLGSALAAQVHALGLAAECVFAGQCSDVADVFHAMDVFVQSSDTEGTPNAVLEAMAFETPVVATDVGGTRDLVTDRTHGLLVPRRQPNALAAAILETLANPVATAARVRAARRRVEGELSFEARMHAVERIYEELAALQKETPALWRPVRDKH